MGLRYSAKIGDDELSAAGNNPIFPARDPG